MQNIVDLSLNYGCVIVKSLNPVESKTLIPILYFMRLLLIFITVLLTEVALFVTIGDKIGVIGTLLIVIITAISGTTFLRYQGLATLVSLKKVLAEGGNVAAPILHGALIFIAGILLLTPGFLTDTIGFSLLIPAIRLIIIRYGIKKFISSNEAKTLYPDDVPGDEVIEGYAKEVQQHNSEQQPQ